MVENEEKIKKDLINLYSEMYMLCQSEYANKFFAKDMIKKLKHKPEVIEKLLNGPQKKIIKKNNKVKKKNSEILKIETTEDAIEYCNTNLLDIFNPDRSEIENKSLINKVTADELKHLYKVIYGIEFKGKAKKDEILRVIKRFIYDKTRTNDLGKKLNL